MGVKVKNNVIYVSYSKQVKALENIPRIYDKRKIKVTVGKDKTAKMKLQGYYVISKEDLNFFINKFKNP